MKIPPEPPAPPPATEAVGDSVKGKSEGADWWSTDAARPSPSAGAPRPRSRDWLDDLYDVRNADTHSATQPSADGGQPGGPEAADSDAAEKTQRGWWRGRAAEEPPPSVQPPTPPAQTAPAGPAPGNEVTKTAAPRRARKETLLDWVDHFSPRQKWVLRNAAAAATGAWGLGAFTGDWETGIPQTVLGWMHSAADSSAYTATPLCIGGFAVLGFALGGSLVVSRVPGAQRLPTLFRTLHFLLIRVPVASAVVALLLFTTT